jgi:asparagine synthase (glutamine-hydrolysing)
VNKHFLLGFLALNSTSVTETGLNEVGTVLPGECIEHQNYRCSREFYWNPLQIAETDIIESPAQAVRQMAEKVRACVHAWASCFRAVELRLSGGLDSSIIAACLSDAPNAPAVLCRNFYSFDPGSDERHFARLVAARTGLQLIEQPANIDQDFQKTRALSRVPSPFSWWALDTQAMLDQNALWKERGIEVTFEGHGGDELFQHAGALPNAVDFAFDHGMFNRGLLSIALDDAAARQISFWTVLNLAFRFRTYRSTWHVRSMALPGLRTLLSSEVREEAWRDLTLWHPLFRAPARIPPGKHFQAYLLTHGCSQNYQSSSVPRAAEDLSPLLSQPVIETCLRIPSYVLSEGGRDRAIARRAFASDLPPAIINRKSKAYGSAQFKVIIDRNIAVVRDLLLDGYLASERFLDRGAVEALLAGNVGSVEKNYLQLGSLLSVEGWARSWRSNDLRAVA